MLIKDMTKSFILSVVFALFSSSCFGFEISDQEFEFFGYEINGQFSRAHENSLGIKEEFVREEETKKNLQYLDLKPLFEFDGLTAHSNYGLVLKNKFLISFNAKFVKTSNNEFVPFETIDRCHVHLENYLNHIKNKYGYNFVKINNNKNNLLISGRFLAEGRLECRETYEHEGYSSKGFVLTVYVLGSKWYQSDFEYREEKEKKSTDKITPFGIEFGKIDVTNFEKLALIEPTKKDENQDPKNRDYEVLNPRFPLSFFDGGKYTISTFDGEVWKVTASVLFHKSQLGDLGEIITKIIKKYGFFVVNTRSFNKEDFYFVEDFSDFEVLMKKLQNDNHPVLILSNLAFDDRYMIELNSYHKGGDYYFYLNYKNRFYESKKKIYEKIQSGNKNNLEKSL